MTGLAFDQPDTPTDVAAIVAALREAGANVTVNNLWILAWLGNYDKLAMSRRILSAHYNLDIDRDPQQVPYAGDSTNDAPMFAFFRHSVGVSTVVRYLAEIPKPPNWIKEGPGGGRVCGNRRRRNRCTVWKLGADFGSMSPLPRSGDRSGVCH